MGGSSSKKEKPIEEKIIKKENIDEIKSIKIEEKENEIKNEKINYNYRPSTKAQEVINDKNDLNIEKIEKKEINKEHENVKDLILLNDIDTLILENNDLNLISNKNNKINLSLNPLTIELPNSQTELHLSDKTENSNKNEKKIEQEISTDTYTEKYCQEFISTYYDKMIEILYNFNFRKIFISLVKSFNETYLCNINLKKFLRNKDTEEFLINLKYSSIIITSFIFLSKDINLYNNHFKKIREIYEQFLNACLDSTNKDILFSYKVFSFMNRYHKNKKNKLNCVNQIIKILFKNKLSYKNISNCLEQLMSNINIESTEDILTKINSTILYYYNSDAQDNEIKYNNDIVINKNITRRSSAGKSYYPSISLKNESSFNSIKLLNKNIYFYKGYNSFSKRNKTKNKISTIHQTEKKINNDFSDSPKPPFIKEEMPKNKKFCLILDIDETLTHFVKLPFGNYFLIRPGVLDLLKELCNYYEIDIFTAALQHYADNILDKLDKNNIYFSHRLYRCHCNWEEGKSIKKLKLIGRDLNKIVFIDDIKRNAKYNMKNLILIKKWSDDIYDQELISIKNKLKYIAECGKYDDDITVGIAEENLNALSYSNNNDE